MIQPFQIVVGRGQQYDPVAGQTTVSIPILKGVRYWVSATGLGFLPESGYENPTDGGLTLLGGADFQSGATYTIIPQGPNWSMPATDAITNGWQYDRVMNALFGRVGWRQPTEAGKNVLNGYNTASASGRYFQSFHALVSPTLIRDVQENRGMTDLQFNDLLIDLQKDCILATLNTVFNKPQLIENKLLFETDDADGLQLVNNQGNFVGVKIRPTRQEVFSAQIKSVQLYFDSAVTFNLYLFHSSKKSPVKTQSVTAVAEELTTVTLTGFFLDNRLSGEYYLGYFQDDLGSAKAIHLDDYPNSFTILHTDFIETPKITGQTNFKRDGIGENRYNYGLNMQIAVFRDYTRMVEDQAHLFDEAIGLQMAVRVLEMYQNSVRSNRTERITADHATQIQTDLNVEGPTDEMPVMPGLKSRLRKEFDRLNENFFPRTKAKIVNVC